MATRMSSGARRLLEGLLEGKGLNELAGSDTPGRAEAEAALRSLLRQSGAGRPRAAARAVSATVSLAEGRVVAYADGASRGNPGPSSYGFRILAADGIELAAEGAPVGRATNNVAEYRGVIAVLERLRDLGVREFELRLDSELIVEQLNGRYKVRSANLIELKRSVDRLLAGFSSVRVVHIPREENREADALANEALDRA